MERQAVVTVCVDRFRDWHVNVPVLPDTTGSDVLQCCLLPGEDPRSCHLVAVKPDSSGAAVVETVISPESKLLDLLLHQLGKTSSNGGSEWRLFVRHDPASQNGGSLKLSQLTEQQVTAGTDHATAAAASGPTRQLSKGWSFAEIQQLAMQQRQQMAATQLELAARERQLLDLEASEVTMSRAAAIDSERLHQLQEHAATQEARLRSVRATMRASAEAVERQRQATGELMAELEAARGNFHQKEVQLTAAVAKVTELTRQLEALKGDVKVGARSGESLLPAGCRERLEQLRQEYATFKQLREQQGRLRTQLQESLSSRQREAARLDGRVEDLRRRKRHLQSNPSSAAFGGPPSSSMRAEWTAGVTASMPSQKTASNVAAVEPFLHKPAATGNLRRLEQPPLNNSSGQKGAPLPSLYLEQPPLSWNRNHALKAPENNAGGHKVAPLAPSAELVCEDVGKGTKSSMNKLRVAADNRGRTNEQSELIIAPLSLKEQHRPSDPVTSKFGRSEFITAALLPVKDEQPKETSPESPQASSAAALQACGTSDLVTAARQSSGEAIATLAPTFTGVSKMTVSLTPVSLPSITAPSNTPRGLAVHGNERGLPTVNGGQDGSNNVSYVASLSIGAGHGNDARQTQTSVADASRQQPIPLQQSVASQPSFSSGSSVGMAGGYRLSLAGSTPRPWKGATAATVKTSAIQAAPAAGGNTSSGTSSAGAVYANGGAIRASWHGIRTAPSATAKIEVADNQNSPAATQSDLGTATADRRQWTATVSPMSRTSAAIQDSGRESELIVSARLAMVDLPPVTAVNSSAHGVKTDPAATASAASPTASTADVARLHATSSQADDSYALSSSRALPPTDAHTWVDKPAIAHLSLEVAPSGSTAATASLQAGPVYVMKELPPPEMVTSDTGVAMVTDPAATSAPQQAVFTEDRGSRKVLLLPPLSPTIIGAPPVLSPSRKTVLDVAKKTNLRRSEVGSDESGRAGSGLRRVSFDPLALLLDAALEGELDLVKITAEQVTNASAANDEGITALHNAICAGHRNVVEYLVEFGCDVNAQDSDGWTPLHCAASCNNLPLVKYLVEHGACVLAATLSDRETAAQKCEEGEEGYDGCHDFLKRIQDELGVANGGIVYALYNYERQQEDELDLVTGQQLTVLRRGDDVETEWWWARQDDDGAAHSSSRREGYVPRNLLGASRRVTLTHAPTE